jgi:predicted amidohydrolase YtcJ
VIVQPTLDLELLYEQTGIACQFETYDNPCRWTPDMKTMKTRYSIKIITTLTLAALTLTVCAEEQVEPISEVLSSANADTLVINAKAWTGNPKQPWVETIAIKDSRIVATGGKDLEADFNATKTIDANGKLVLPGFIDNHVHFMDGAATLLNIDTQSAKTKQAFITKIKNYALSIPEGEWITGGIWDHEAWGGELPHRDWIDEHTQKNPVFLTRTDGHMGIANSLALEMSGINKETLSSEGGLIVRDPNGDPTGVLKDNALMLVTEKMPRPSEAQNNRLFDAAIAHGLINGVTQVHNVDERESQWSNIAIFEKAKAEGRLKIRTYYIPHISNRHRLSERIKTQGKGDNWLRFGGVKQLVDGSLGSTTAWFYEPYSDAPETNGFPLMPMKELKSTIAEAHALGLQLIIHGIGDRTNDEILRIFEELNVLGSRPRIEHAQHLSQAAIKRFAELGVTPSMHPYHAIDDGRWAEKRIGAERIKTTYAFKSLIDAGATLSFGSDWYVAPLNPIAGIYAAVTRRTLDGKNPDGWIPAEKITVEQAIRAYTVNNAFTGFQENELGSIEVNKLADLVILSDNIFEIDPQNIIDTKVTLTMVGGEVMYSR